MGTYSDYVELYKQAETMAENHFLDALGQAIFI